MSEREDAVIAALGDRTYPFGLELGAGDGRLSERLARRCGRLITLEASPAEVRRARERLTAVPNVDARVGTAFGELPVWRFDLVVCTDPAPPLVDALERVLPRAATVLAVEGAEALRDRSGFVRVGASGGVERYERR